MLAHEEQQVGRHLRRRAASAAAVSRTGERGDHQGDDRDEHPEHGVLLAQLVAAHHLEEHDQRGERADQRRG